MSKRWREFIPFKASIAAGFLAVAAASAQAHSPPAIFGVTNTIASAGNPVWVTAGVTDNVSVASVMLAYSTDVAAVFTNTVFLETMATNAVKPWTGGGCNQPWTVSYNGGNPFQQTNSANYGSGNPCGLQFKDGTTNLSDSAITTADDINALGNSGTVGFNIQTSGLSNNAGWAMQLNSGAGFTTRLSELTGTNHNWQFYSYNLQPGDLVSNLALRFQFAGGSTNNRIFLDYISVIVVAGGGSWTNTPMYDDGLHNDGAAGDGVYGGEIPAFPSGATVSYFLTATDEEGLSATNPVGAPVSDYSYTATSNNASPVVYDLMLGRPTDTSIAVNVLANNDLQVYCEYGTQSGVYTGKTATNFITNDVPTALTIGQLQANQRYYYCLCYSTNNGASFGAGTEHTFVTQRARGSTFTFDIEADPHFNDVPGTVPAIWQQTLTNILADQPDFLIDLGDTFMGEKYAAANPYTMTQPGILAACAAVRGQFFNIIGHSVPLFLVDGNHDPELGWWLDTNAPHANPPVWGAGARELYYACPIPGGFYSGATNNDYYMQEPRDGYYAFEWGDALFIMIDPFWYSDQGVAKSSDPWQWTLGTNQYYWLKSALENSTATYKFVFSHHLIGGSWDGVARGGLEFSPCFEWGGLNSNGTPGFATQRPGWPMPIRDLLLSNKAQVFFHGHDHLYCKQDYFASGVSNGVPDLIYQEVPQPSHYPYDLTNYATGTNFDYNYQTGVFYGSAGHLRVTVSPTNVTVEYVRSYQPSYPPTVPGPGITNQMVSYSYNVPAPTISNGNTNLTLAGSISGGKLVLQWNSQPGFCYTVQWSEDLVTWSNIFAGQTNAWSDTNPIVAVTNRFYRVVQ
jgi:hypothetical protein